MPIKTGQSFRRGKFAYFPKEPYITNGTVRDNITFGTDFDSVRYYKAISISRLSNEICFTENKDDYPIASFQFNREQLERICFARAIFCDRFVTKMMFLLFTYVRMRINKFAINFVCIYIDLCVF